MIRCKVLNFKIVVVLPSKSCSKLYAYTIIFFLSPKDFAPSQFSLIRLYVCIFSQLLFYIYFQLVSFLRTVKLKEFASNLIQRKNVLGDLVNASSTQIYNRDQALQDKTD